MTIIPRLADREQIRAGAGPGYSAQTCKADNRNWGVILAGGESIHFRNSAGARVDHRYLLHRCLHSALNAAFQIAARQTDSVVVPPEGPEVEYGSIETGLPLACPKGGAYHVRRFCDKPSIVVATEFFNREAVSNTFVMVGHVQSFFGPGMFAA